MFSRSSDTMFSLLAQCSSLVFISRKFCRLVTATKFYDFEGAALFTAYFNMPLNFIQT